MLLRKEHVSGWTIYIDYPAEYFPDLDERINAICEGMSHDSGVGMGNRDMQIFFNEDEGGAKEAVRLLDDIKELTNLSLVYEVTETYVYKEQPEDPEELAN